MDHDKHLKKYRGVKLIILAALLLGAVGLTLYSNGTFQADRPMAGANETVQEIANVSEEHREGLMAKTTEIKERIGNPSDKIHDKASGAATVLTDKADQMVASSTPSDKQWTENMNAVADQAGEMISEDVQAILSKFQGDKTSTGPGERHATEQVQMDARPTLPIEDIEKTVAGSEAFHNKVSSASVETIQPPSSKVVYPASDTTDQNRSSLPGTARKCPTPPAKGQDLGTRYVVAYCETLSIISERTGIGVNDLIEHNPQVANPDLIYPNQELRLPPRG